MKIINAVPRVAGATMAFRGSNADNTVVGVSYLTLAANNDQMFNVERGIQLSHRA